MQCPVCQFHNMPGPRECGSCGARLEAPAGEFFLPPRSTPWQQIWRRFSRRPIRQAEPEVADRARRRRARTLSGLRWLRRFINPDPTVPVWRDSPVLAGLLSAVLPGAGHLYLRQFRKGLPTTAVAVVLGLVMTRYLYTATGTWTIGFYCMLGGWALFDCALRLPRSTAWQRFLLGLALVSALLLLLTPVAERLNGFWRIYEITIAAPLGPFPEGAALQFDRQSYVSRDPEIGDLVFTRARQINIVLGGPGDYVQWDTATLKVNGEERPGIRPLAAGVTPPSFSATVPKGHYLVLPRVFGDAAGETRLYQSLVIPEALVPRRDVLYRYAGAPPVQLEPTRAEGDSHGPGAVPAQIRQ